MVLYLWRPGLYLSILSSSSQGVQPKTRLTWTSRVRSLSILSSSSQGVQLGGYVYNVYPIYDLSILSSSSQGVQRDDRSEAPARA